MDKEQVFIHHSIYPSAVDIFNMELLSIEKIKNDSIYVIDTNALLIPYTTSSSGFDEIKKAYTNLIKKNQLIIPGQVAREFAKNRPEKIKTLFQQLNRIRDKVQKPSTGQYPLLEKMDEFNEAIKIEKEIAEVQDKYSKKIGEILDKIKGWRWNDPITEVYNKLFSPKVIYELEFDKDEVLAELEKRNRFSIPPGYKDRNKDDGGIGDLLIWLSIIDISKKMNKHIVFVSGDEKNDWFHRTENFPLYPRFELLAEFKSKTDNKSFHIIKLSELLARLGADEKAVKEVEIKEKSIQLGSNDFRRFAHEAEYAVFKWLSKTEPGKDIAINKGHPYFVVQDSEKTEGIDVLIIRERKYVVPVLHRLNNRFLRAYHKVSEGDFDCFRIIFVGETREVAEANIKSFTPKLRKKFTNEFIDVSFGFINPDGDFELA